MNRIFRKTTFILTPLSFQYPRGRMDNKARGSSLKSPSSVPETVHSVKSAVASDSSSQGKLSPCVDPQLSQNNHWIPFLIPTPGKNVCTHLAFPLKFLLAPRPSTSQGDCPFCLLVQIFWTHHSAPYKLFSKQIIFLEWFSLVLPLNPSPPAPLLKVQSNLWSSQVSFGANTPWIPSFLFVFIFIFLE